MQEKSSEQKFDAVAKAKQLTVARIGRPPKIYDTEEENEKAAKKRESNRLSRQRARERKKLKLPENNETKGYENWASKEYIEFHETKKEKDLKDFITMLRHNEFISDEAFFVIIKDLPK